MKKILLSLLLIPSLTWAQNIENSSIAQVELRCFSLEHLETILENYKEQPFLRAKSIRVDGDFQTNTFIYFFLNTETKTWTIVEKSVLDDFCVIAVGNNLEWSDKTIKKLLNQRETFRF